MVKSIQPVDQIVFKINVIGLADVGQPLEIRMFDGFLKILRIFHEQILKIFLIVVKNHY